MDSRRQLKIASLIQQAFTEILSKESKGFYSSVSQTGSGQTFVTVTRVTVTSDLTLARFYLSIFNAEDPDKVVEKFTWHKHELKRHLAEKLRHQLRRIPEIEFFRDDTLEQAYNLEEVFKKIDAENREIEMSKTRVKSATLKTRLQDKQALKNVKSRSGKIRQGKVKKMEN
jgi:ribosome-binding factor A